jgi:hypothetical protein
MAKRTFRVVRKNRKSRRRIKGGDDTIPDVPKKVNKKIFMKALNMFRKYLPNYPTINETTRFHILKYRQNQLKCKKSRYETLKSMSLTRQENENPLDKATCDEIKKELDAIRNMQGVFGKLKRNLMRYGLMRSVINMSILSRLHYVLYTGDFSTKHPKISSMAKYFFFRNCGKKPEPTDLEFDESLIKDNIDIPNNQLHKEYAKSSDNEANGVGINEVNTTEYIKSLAKEIYDAEHKEFPDCDDTHKLSVIEHITLLEFFYSDKIKKGGITQQFVRDAGSYLLYTGIILIVIGVIGMETTMVIAGDPSPLGCVISGVIIAVIAIAIGMAIGSD